MTRFSRIVLSRAYMTVACLSPVLINATGIKAPPPYNFYVIVGPAVALMLFKLAISYTVTKAERLAAHREERAGSFIRVAWFVLAAPAILLLSNEPYGSWERYTCIGVLVVAFFGTFVTDHYATRRLRASQPDTAGQTTGRDRWNAGVG